MSQSQPADTAAELVGVLSELLPARRPLGLNEPMLGSREQRYLTDCLASGWVSSTGEYVDQFEQSLAGFTDIPHAVATVNGTAALHLILKACGVGRDDEVLVPSLTFVGTVNPVCYLGATPHLVDVERESLGVDPVRLGRYLEQICERRPDGCHNAVTGRRIRALIGVHVLGHPCQAPALAALCDDYGIDFIEDAAESLGSYRDDRHTGHWGRAAALSFNGNKIITTGGGGAVITADPQLAGAIRHLATTAKTAHAWEFVHDRCGFNYRLPNLNAALGCAQLDDLEKRLAQRRRDSTRLHEALAGLRDIELQQPPDGCRSNHWLHLALLADQAMRDRVLEIAHADQLQLRPLWRPLHLQDYLSDCPQMPCSVAEDLYRRGVCLPGVLAARAAVS